MADQNNTEASFVQYDIEFGGELVSFDQRKMNAVRAYFEWMPIRQVEMDDNLRIWRTFSIGTLFDLIMLDTRQYDRSITGKLKELQIPPSVLKLIRWQTCTGTPTIFIKYLTMPVVR